MTTSVAGDLGWIPVEASSAAFAARWYLCSRWLAPSTTAWRLRLYTSREECYEFAE